MENPINSSRRNNFSNAELALGQFRFNQLQNLTNCVARHNNISPARDIKISDVGRDYMVVLGWVNFAAVQRC